MQGSGDLVRKGLLDIRPLQTSPAFRRLWIGTSTLACLAVASAADTVSVISRGTLVQPDTPDGFGGRISSMEYAVDAGGPGLGDARAGLVAGLVSASASAVSGGLACVLAVAVIAGTHPALRRWRRPVPVGDEA